MGGWVCFRCSSVAWPRGGLVHYRLVSEIQVEKTNWYGLELLDKVLWLKMNMSLKY
jgi:hypothetical protein